VRLKIPYVFVRALVRELVISVHWLKFILQNNKILIVNKKRALLKFVISIEFQLIVNSVASISL